MPAVLGPVPAKGFVPGGGGRQVTRHVSARRRRLSGQRRGGRRRSPSWQLRVGAGRGPSGVRDGVWRSTQVGIPGEGRWGRRQRGGLAGVVGCHPRRPRDHLPCGLDPRGVECFGGCRQIRGVRFPFHAHVVLAPWFACGAQGRKSASESPALPSFGSFGAPGSVYEACSKVRARGPSRLHPRAQPEAQTPCSVCP